MNKLSILRIAATAIAVALIGTAAHAQQGIGKSPPDTGPAGVEQRKAEDASERKNRQGDARKERREHRKAVNHRQRRKH